MASIFQFFPNSRPDSVNRKIFRAAAIVAGLSILARIAATLKELVVAHTFGRSDALDAFLIAFVLPSFVINLIMGGLGSALLPVLVETRQREGEDAATKLLSNILLVSILALIGAAVFMALCAPLYLPFLAHSFSPEKLLLTRKLLYPLLPWMIFNGLATLLSYIMNAGEKFALPAMVPLITPLVTIVFIIAFKAQGALSLALGTAAGGLIEAIVLFRILAAHDVRLSLRWGRFDPAVRKVLAQYAPMMAVSFLMGSALVVDQSFAAMLPAGSVAALSYANKISNVILVIGGTALSTATLPYFSRMVAENDWFGCRHTLKRYVALIMAIAVPVTVMLIVFSKPIVRVLYQRGAFTSADTQVVSLVQACYCLQIPFQLLALLFARFISSVRRNDLILYAAAANLTVNIVMDLVLMKIWGIAGIALSTTLMNIVSLVFLSISSIKLLNQQATGTVAAVEAHARG